MTMDLYEQKYKDALRRAKKLQETCDSTAVVGWCEYIFPELKESEDERIRESIIELVKQSSEVLNKQNQKDMIAWLEKQGRMLDPDKVIEWLENKQPSVGVYDKFKKDFGL